MKKIRFLVIFFLLLSPLTVVFADDHFDPFERNLIFVEGESQIYIPINEFSLRFGFDIDKPTFEEASRVSSAIINEIDSRIKKIELTHVELIKGWDLVKQARIAIGSKGRKISNQLTVKVVNFPEGKLHELIAKIIDSTVSVEGSITLEDVKVSVSEELENKKKGEVMEQALKALQENANQTAQALGKGHLVPKRVYLSNQQSMGAEAEYAMYDRAAVASMMKISLQKSFNVQAEIVDHVKLTAKVSGVYQMD